MYFFHFNEQSVIHQFTISTEWEENLDISEYTNFVFIVACLLGVVWPPDQIIKQPVLMQCVFWHTKHTIANNGEVFR